MTAHTTPLPLPRRVHLGFGRALGAACQTARPDHIEAVQALLHTAHERQMPVTLRGAGRSYGDASISDRGVVIDMTRMNRILAWDPESGVMDLEPGATIEDVWRTSLPDGYWPAVVPGTMRPTMGGCVAMNIHGKNHFCQGPFGDHVQQLEVLTPTGQRVICSRTAHPDLFHATIGGFGALGVTTAVQLKLKQVESGFLKVSALSVPNLDALFEAFESRIPEADYLVGWVDLFAKGKGLGRGVIHDARYCSADEDPMGPRSLVEGQALPERFFGVIPPSWMWRLLKPWVNNVGMRVVNEAKYRLSQLVDRRGRTFLQSHVAFAFLLDYVPRWRDAYGLGGFIQVQPFLPAETANVTMKKIVTACHDHGIVPYLGVFKRHRADDFLLSHALDGYSMAMDIRVTRANRQRVWELGQQIGDLVVEAGGHFYFAKDAVTTAQQVQASFGQDRLDAFAQLKSEVDPNGILTTALSRRLLPHLPAATGSTA